MLVAKLYLYNLEHEMSSFALLHDQLGFNSFMQMIMIMPFD